jgi:hypothetical protein
VALTNVESFLVAANILLVFIVCLVGVIYILHYVYVTYSDIIFLPRIRIERPQTPAPQPPQPPQPQPTVREAAPWASTWTNVAPPAVSKGPLPLGERKTVVAVKQPPVMRQTPQATRPLPPQQKAASDQNQLGGYETAWKDISRKYRQSVGWICEKCRVNCAGETRLLHTHHMNGIKMDNRFANLQALCVDCHSNEPGEGHSWMREKAKEDGRLAAVAELRRRQGLPRR